MNPNVFICYSEENLKIAEDVCSFLENNDVSCWIKSRDLAEDASVYDITKAIQKSESFVLIYSNDSKNSNYATTEVDIAFSSDIPILVFDVDNTPIDGKLGFYLKDKPYIDAASNPEEKYDDLLSDVRDIIGMPESKADTSIPSDDKSVYLCYANEDESSADAVYQVMNDNNIKTWSRHKDMGVNDSVSVIPDKIKGSDAFILIYSNDSNNSGYVKTETEIAKSTDVPKFVYKVDESEIGDTLKSNLGDAQIVDEFPDLKGLVKNTSKSLGKEISNPVIERNLKAKKSNKRTAKVKKDTKAEKPKSRFSKKIIALLIIAIMVAGIGVIAYTALDSGSLVVHTDVSIDSPEEGIEITDVNIDGKDEYFDKYIFVYAIVGKNIDLSKCSFETDFYDDGGNVVSSTTKIVSSQDEIIDNEYMVAEYYGDDFTLSKVVVKVSQDGSIIAEEEYSM